MLLQFLYQLVDYKELDIKVFPMIKFAQSYFNSGMFPGEETQ